MIEIPASSSAKSHPLGQRLKAAMAGRHTQESLAEAVGASLSGVKKWLSGVADPGWSSVVAVAAACEVSLDWLATGQGPMRPSAEEADGARYQRLRQIQDQGEREALPIPLETLRQRPDLDSLRQELFQVARREELPASLRGYADLLLHHLFADVAAAGRAERRLQDVAGSLHHATARFEAATRRSGWTPPAPLALLLRDLIVLYDVSEDHMAALLAAWMPPQARQDAE